MRKLLVLGLLLFPSLLVAQVPIDITPYVGWRWGGSIDSAIPDPTNLFWGETLEIEDAGSYGLIVGFGVGYNLQIELSASRQESELIASDRIFAPGTVLGDIDVTYYQAGVTWEWGRDVRPFLGGSLGAATLDPKFPMSSSETRFAGSFFGGLKLRLTDRLGVRLDGKMLWIALDDDDRDFCRGGCYDGYGGNGVIQGEVAMGLIIYF